jgi:nucleotide-binding universal stress UspA family protein
MATSNDDAARATAVVLVGIDFTDTSLEALKTAENLARAEPGSELHLVHALAVPTLPPDPQELFAQAHNMLGVRHARAREELDRLAAAATNGIARVTGHLRNGSPAAAICELALDIGADLIVIGAQHHTGVSRLIFGSVSEKVSRIAPCPVLIIRPKTVPIWERIEPPCPDCAHVQRMTHGDKMWCERHSQHRIRPHTYHEAPFSYGIGAMTFRPN